MNINQVYFDKDENNSSRVRFVVDNSLALYPVIMNKKKIHL